jgi:hypothetical protein
MQLSEDIKAVCTIGAGLLLYGGMTAAAITAAEEISKNEETEKVVVKSAKSGILGLLWPITIPYYCLFHKTATTPDASKDIVNGFKKILKMRVELHNAIGDLKEKISKMNETQMKSPELINALGKMTNDIENSSSSGSDSD